MWHAEAETRTRRIDAKGGAQNGSSVGGINVSGAAAMATALHVKRCSFKNLAFAIFWVFRI